MSSQKKFGLSTPYLLLLPGMGFLFTFFIVPIINLAQTSTQTPVAGGDTGQYEQTLRFQNYIDAFVENKEQFGRSFIYAIIATLSVLGKLSSTLADKAELARIGRYYATESMLVWDETTARYDADATPSTGSDTLWQHYQALVSGGQATELGDHSVF